MNELEAEWSGRDVADPAVVAQISEDIRVVIARRGLQAMLDVGALLFERCYGGSAANLGVHATIEAVAAAPDAPMGRTSLYRAVRILLQARQLPEDVRDALSPSQHVALLQVPAAHLEKERLAREAARTGMPARELTDRARELVGKPPRTEITPEARSEGLQPLSKATRLLRPWSVAIRAGRKPTPKEADAVRAELVALRAIVADLAGWVE